jgi:hypothetical protein
MSIWENKRTSLIHINHAGTINQIGTLVYMCIGNDKYNKYSLYSYNMIYA